MLLFKKECILSITHQQDVDGLFCAAILKILFPILLFILLITVIKMPLK